MQVCIFAFDMLYVDGEALTQQPLRERRQRLTELLAGADPSRMRMAASMEIFPTAQGMPGRAHNKHPTGENFDVRGA